MQPPEVKKTGKRAKTPEQALAALMRLCARAEKSQNDARRLMRGWGLAEREGEQVLARLVRDRFIDDGRYAEAFVRDKLRLSGWGEYKIRTALQRKHIDRELIDAALAQAGRQGMGGIYVAVCRRPAVRIWPAGCGSSWNARCGRPDIRHNTNSKPN